MNITQITRSYLHYKVKKRNVAHNQIVLLLVVFLTLIVSSIATIYLSKETRELYSQLPTAESIKAELNRKGENSFLYDRNGVLLYTFRDPNLDREYLEQSEITDNIKLALLAAEDREFYSHPGVDPISMLTGLARSVFSDGEKLVGGSTITQQLAKNVFLTGERSFERKIKEAMLSFMIEKEYSKEQILEYYLNTVSFGSRVTGIKTAAKNYFSKEVKDLSFNEAAFLIAIIQNPNELSPIYSYDQARAWELNDVRRNYIINQAIDHYDYFDQIFTNIPTEQELANYHQLAIEINPQVNNIQAPHFVFYVQSILAKPPYNISTEQLFTGGYHIYSSLDLSMQKVAEAEILPAVNQIGPVYGFNNAALITINPNNGDILVMQGSKDYWGVSDSRRKFDPKVNVTLSQQNLGSSLKPFLTYMAIDRGLYSRYSTIMDTPQTFVGSYTPKNVDGRFLGPLTLDQALKFSRNLPFVKIIDQVGVGEFNRLLRDLGYTGARSGNTYGHAAALGGVSETLLDHAYAYSTLATLGTRAEPRPILKITQPRSGLERSFDVVTHKVLNSRAASEVNRMLGDKSYRTDNHWMVALNGNHKMAGKTGTTDQNRQNYYIGYSPKLLTAVWNGNNDNSPLSGRSFGSTSALPIWYRYTSRLLREHPEYIEWGNY